MPTIRTTPLTQPVKAATSTFPKLRALRVGERSALAKALEQSVGSPVDPKLLKGKLNPATNASSFSYIPSDKSWAVTGSVSLAGGTAKITEMFRAESKKPASTGSTFTPTAPAVKPGVIQPAVPAVKLAPLSGDAKTQAAQFLDYAYRLQAAENKASSLAMRAVDAHERLPEIEKKSAERIARCEYMARVERWNADSYRLSAAATEKTLVETRKAVADNDVAAAQARAEYEALRQAVEPMRNQGESVLVQLQAQDLAEFTQLRNAAMKANGLYPPVTPGAATIPGSALIDSPNGNKYGADAQGHANMLAADPAGRLWGYVNPTPVISQTNPWSSNKVP